MTLYLGKSLERLWRRVLSEAVDALIACPYVTPTLASQLVADCRKTKLILLTRFELDDFVSGASSLDVLRQFVCSGARVLAIPDLHAKIVLTKDCATLGSQNLTGRSRRNIEASIIIRAPDRLLRIRRFLDTLSTSSEAVNITNDDIDRMEERCKEFAAEWHQLQSRLKEASQELKAEQAERNRALRLTREQAARQAEEHRRSIQVATVRRRIEGLPNVGQSRKLALLVNNRKYVLRNAPGAPSLLSWKLRDGTSVEFKKGHRYPVFESVSGKVAWLRLNETECSLFSTGYVQNIHGWELNLSSRDLPPVANVSIRLTRPNSPQRVVNMWLDDKGVTIVERTNCDNDPDILAPLGISNESLDGYLERKIIGSFNFNKGSRWAGQRVNELFNVTQGTAQMQAIRLPTGPLLVLDLTDAR